MSLCLEWAHHSLSERGSHANQSTRTRQKCGCVMSERNLPEVMCTARAGRQRNVNDTRWNVALKDTVRTQTRSRVWKAVFTADLGVNAFFTTSLVWQVVKFGKSTSCVLFNCNL